MPPINAFPKGQHNTGGASCVRICAALTQRHLNNLSGRVLLPLGRDSAGTLTRANSRECCASARLSGLYFLDASKRLCRQARRHLSRVHVHLKFLSSAASPDGSKTIGKLLDDGKILFAKKQKLHD